jgi:hydroxyacylglutathione hydrolase
MIIKRLYDDGLAQASWLVGCAATGEALVVDPNRDIERYVQAAAAEGLRLTHVTETHIHADFVSGLRELATRTGARAYLSAEGGPDWQYSFADELDAVLLRDGDVIRVGNVRVQVLHTPGHTPEHLSFLVTDTAGADRPMGAFTGDFIFVGDVGRPDLLEKAAGIRNTMAAGARQLYASLQRFKELPDFLQLWPGHGAGSACGKALGAVPQSTLGYERLFNWGLAAPSEQQFVGDVLAGQPEPPKYFAVMKRVNREGPRLLHSWPSPPRLAPAAFRERLAAGVPVIDLRTRAEFSSAHLPGTLSIPFNRSFSTWAGSLLSYERDLYLVTPAALVAAAVRQLALIGMDRVAGWVDSGDLELPPARVAEVDAAEACARLADADVTILDVRGRSEWDAGHAPVDAGAAVRHIPLGDLPDRLHELPRDRPLLVHCQAGSRSAMAVSLLEAHGFTNATNVRDGFDGWRAAGCPVQRETALAGASS